MDPDPLVRGTDPDPSISIIKKKFYLTKNDVHVPSKSNKQKNLEKKIVCCWRLEGQG
jgi:hypothetical protein